MSRLELKPETALSHQKINGMILRCFENERPLAGMLGELDWRLNGHFTTLLRSQLLTGKPGESVYAPLLWNERTFHFLVIGSGPSRREASVKFSKDQLKQATELANRLYLTRMGISARDWNGALTEDSNLWILN